MDARSEIERLKALVAAIERYTAQVNAYADSLALECERKEKEASELRKQVAALKEDLKSNYGINICGSDN
ncbi:hypothetical protein [Parabacteroides sp. ZJ-118]|uniref:hypothetical protein n=1 Tax=Parabacteroides sp. ZJ-118 TaxID=2709398 RepID=UPI0013EC75C9|nr:hypothetical protein [Parabacteroides sp. ZJ-118]